MRERVTWQELRSTRPDTPEYHAAYDRARRAFELGAAVRRLREERGISQSELARRIGWKQPALARLEAGGAEPRLDTLDLVSGALDMDVIVEFRQRRPIAAQA